jgi:serine phosphatase RsbU (regulator of sigma subunit)
VLLAVGDMAGHGLGAASGMARLRFSLMAWLSIGIDDPGMLLGHLNRLCTRLRLTGTVALAVFDPAAGTLRWGRAGHPAPLVGSGGRAWALDLPDGLLLGADPAEEYPTRTLRLAAGDVLLLYTDGLVERRGGEGLGRRILDVLAAASAEPDGTALARLAEGLDHPSPYDDTCTLAVRVLGG